MDPSALTKTSFCGKEIDNVTNNDTKKFILDDMRLKCGNIHYNTRYAKVYNEQYSRNLNNPHIICLKTSGTPYLLYCTRINEVNYCFLIDKKIKEGYDFPKIFLVHYQFDTSLFEGSLFETELLRDKNNNWFLLLADTYYYKSNKCNQVIMERVNILHKTLTNEYSDNFTDICPIQVKKYFDFKDYNVIKEFIKSLNYNVRGLYFVPIKTSYSKILYLFKDKDLEITKVKKNTLHFVIKSTLKRDVYDLYLQGPNNIVKQGIACIPNLKCSKMIREVFSGQETDTDIHVECQYNDKFNKWQPLKVSEGPMSKVEDV